DGVHRVVGPRSFDVDVERGGVTAEPLRTDTKLVDLGEHVELERRHLGVRMPHAHWPRGRLFRQGDTLVGGTTQAHSYDEWWARLPTSGSDAFEDELLDPWFPVSRKQHLEERPVLRPGALGHHEQFEIICPCVEIEVQHRNALSGGILAVHALDRVHDARPERGLERRLARRGLDNLAEAPAIDIGG